jgi:hypothetical protein
MFSKETGRFCFSGFRDCLQEGNKSSFLEYGSGITSYFKFLKWCGWLFFFLTIVYYVPTAIMDSKMNFMYLSGENAYVYGILEIGTSLLFLGAFVWLKYFEKYERLTVGYDTISAEDYTVFIKNLPPDTTLETLRAHFRSYPINRIQLVEHNKEIIDLLKRANNETNPVRYEIIKNKLREKRMSETQDAEAKHAFVTFEQAKYADLILKKYQYGNWWHYYTQLYDLRLNRKHKLYVLPAPSPTTILWENLLVSTFEQVLRQCATWLVSLSILVASFLFLAWTKVQEHNLNEQNLSEKLINSTSTAETTLVDNCETAENCFLFLRSNVYSMLGSIAVVVVNFILTQIMDQLSLFEKHHSLNSKSVSTAFKLFIMQFINTSILLLLVNASFFVTSDSYEQFSDFEYPGWYELIGKSIMFSLVFNIVTPHISQALVYYSSCCALTKSKEWDFSVRYASIYSTVFSAFMFSSRLPIMYPIGACTMFVRFWVDKILFLKVQGSVPAYTMELQELFSNSLLVSWIIHLTIGLWMLSAADESSVDANAITFEWIYTRLIFEQPVLFWFTVGLFFVILCYTLKNDFLLHFASCGFYRRKRIRQDRKLDVSNMMTFSEALAQNKVMTYNMLELQKYREDFSNLLSRRDRGITRDQIELSELV